MASIESTDIGPFTFYGAYENYLDSGDRLELASLFEMLGTCSHLMSFRKLLSYDARCATLAFVSWHF